MCVYIYIYIERERKRQRDINIYTAPGRRGLHPIEEVAEGAQALGRHRGGRLRRSALSYLRTYFDSRISYLVSRIEIERADASASAADASSPRSRAASFSRFKNTAYVYVFCLLYITVCLS